MRYLLPFLLFFATLLSAGDGPRSVTTTLTDVKANSAVAKGVHLPVGVSGIVVHHYDQTHAAIVSSAFVTGDDPKGTTLKLVPYRGLRQPNLPTVKTPPSDGDTVILGYLYDRVAPIVPNEKSFETARRRFGNLTLIHPDLIAAELAKDKTPIPDKAHLQRACEKFSLGLVMFMFSDGTDFIDCISWKRVAHSDVASVDPKQFKQPFYNRFEKIPSPFYSWGEHKITDFDRFYKKMESQR